MEKLWLRRRDNRLPDGNWQIDIFKDKELQGPPVTVIMTSDQHRRFMGWRKTDDPIKDTFPDLSDEDCRKLVLGE